MKRWVVKVELENVELTCGVGALGELWLGKEVGEKSRVRKSRVDMVEKVELENVSLTWGVGALGGVMVG